MIQKILLLCAGLCCGAAMAANIAVVDLVRIVEESKAAQSVAAQVKSKRASLVSQQQAEKAKLEADDKALMQERSVLAQDVFKEKALDFQQKVIASQQSLQEKQRKLEQSYVASIQKIRNETVAIIAELAAEKRFDVAVAKSELLYSAGATDISEEVLSALNSRLTSVPLQ